MTTKEHIKHWLDSAEYDLLVSESLFQAGHYSWCLFIGHLVLEKTLKALFVQSAKNEIPPKIHNLLKLAELSQIKLTEEQLNLFADINRFHIEGRYTEYKNEINKIATKDFSILYIQKIKEQHLWLKSLIT